MRSLLAVSLLFAAASAAATPDIDPASINMATLTQVSKQGVPFGCQIEFRSVVSRENKTYALTGSVLALVDIPVRYLVKATFSELKPETLSWTEKRLSFLGLFLKNNQVAKATATIRPCSDTGTCLSFSDDEASLTSHIYDKEFSPDLRFALPEFARDVVLKLDTLPQTDLPKSPVSVSRRFALCVDELLGPKLEQVRRQSGKNGGLP